MYQGYSVWASALVYNLGETVYGTDSNLFIAILTHKSTSTNCPITGVDYELYWGAAAPKVPRSRKRNGIEMPKMVSNTNKVSKPISYKTQMKFGGTKGNLS